MKTQQLKINNIILLPNCKAIFIYIVLCKWTYFKAVFFFPWIVCFKNRKSCVSKSNNHGEYLQCQLFNYVFFIKFLNRPKNYDISLLGQLNLYNYYECMRAKIANTIYLITTHTIRECQITLEIDRLKQLRSRTLRILKNYI